MGCCGSAEWDKAERSALQRLFDLLDEGTRLPTIMVELREAGRGYVEINGKNHLNIYGKLGKFLAGWGCVKVEWGNTVPYCDLKYKLFKVKTRGFGGENNMGQLTMQLVNFMANQHGWTLALCNGGSIGQNGKKRETQIKFSAPNPLNLVTPHLLVELRTAGYVEVNGEDFGGVYGALGAWLQENWGATPYDWGKSPPFCGAKFKTDRLKKRGEQGENNVGQKTMEIADFMEQELGWTMVTCQGGGIGPLGIEREQQMIFKNTLAGKPPTRSVRSNLIIELRQYGYVEINGKDVGGIYAHLHTFLTGTWGCAEYGQSSGWFRAQAPFCDLKYKCNAFKQRGTQYENNLGMLTTQIIECMQVAGWSLLILNGGGVKSRGENPRTFREVQIKFQSPDPNKPPQPILLVELRDSGYVEINGADTAGVYGHLREFLTKYMKCTEYLGAKWCSVKYSCGMFHKRGDDGENNIGMYTMRLADFLCDHIGGWDLVACSGQNLGRCGTDREQLLAFRHIGAARRPLPQFRGAEISLGGSVEGLVLPPTWTLTDRSKLGADGIVVRTGQVTSEELGMLQALMDETFKAKKTRDRKGDLPQRLQVIQAVVSENVELYRRYFQAQTAANPAGANKKWPRRPRTLPAANPAGASCGPDGREPSRPRTLPDGAKPAGQLCQSWRPVTASSRLASWAQLSALRNEAWLFHGTSPSSAISILQSGFSVDLAGSSVGTMFGQGVYMAERSSKADEYAKGDEIQPDICAALVCRVFVGRCHVVQEPGNYADKMASGEVETVIGDREAAVGTYREFIIGSGDRIYPEFAVLYRRVFEGGVVRDAPAEGGVVRDALADAPPEQQMAGKLAGSSHRPRSEGGEARDAPADAPPEQQTADEPAGSSHQQGSEGGEARDAPADAPSEQQTADEPAGSSHQQGIDEVHARCDAMLEGLTGEAGFRRRLTSAATFAAHFDGV